MFNPADYENAGPAGVGVLEIEGGGAPPEGEPRRFVPLKRTELAGEVVGPLASLRLSQRFGYTREQCDRVLEAAYRFPLPGDAAVTGVRVRFGPVEIRTQLKERPEAELEYDAARREGRQATLLSRESPSVFTLRVAGIQPDQDVVVETAYVQRARAEGAGWSLRVPLTTAPRYVREDEGASRHAQGQPLALLRDPGHRFTLELTLRGAGEVSSPTHALLSTPDGDQTRIRLQEGEALPDRDCVLNWQPRQERDRSSFHVWLHDDRGADHLYFLALLAPPAVREPGDGIPREAILLVDHSGSMHGPKWAAADWAVKQFLSGLSERDTFNLGLFHTSTQWFANAPRRADAAALAAAVRFLEEQKDSGGTNLGVALEQALQQERGEGEVARHVLVLTDAQVSDEGRLLHMAHREAQRPDRRRISVLCIDAAPNAFLAGELAARGGGVARFLTSDPEQEDITTAVDEVLADWAQPVLSGLELDVNRPDVQAVGREVRENDEGRSRIDLGDLPAGRALWVAGRTPRAEGAPLTFRVVTPPEREVKVRRLDPTQATHDLPAVKALVGARQISGLEHLLSSHLSGAEWKSALRRLGYDPEKVRSLTTVAPGGYEENRRRENEAGLRTLLVQESLTYGLISSETAFVGVRTEAGKPVEETVVVANALPAGWSEEFLLLGGRAATPARHPAATGFGGGVIQARMATPLGSPGFSLDGSPSLIGGALMSSPPISQPAASSRTLFADVPHFLEGEAVLFDSSRDEDAGQLSESGTLTSLAIRFPVGTPAADSLDPGLALLVYVGDLSQPRARVRLADLIRQGGERPLNLRRRPGERMRIVLLDATGAWARDGEVIEVAVGVA
jgi:Ca-activated chloride channel family protein